MINKDSLHFKDDEYEMNRLDECIHGGLHSIDNIDKIRLDFSSNINPLGISTKVMKKITKNINNISGIYHASGDYDTALEYLKKSLAIRQEIGDVAGLCATMFNIGHIYWQNEEIPQAMKTWVETYRLAKSINLAQALDALRDLAKQLKLPGGLDGWEKLAKQIEKM